MSSPALPRPSLTNQLWRWSGTLAVLGGIGLLTLAGGWFLRRDALKYLDWSPEVYLRFWPQRHFLAIHVFTASLALIAAPLQFITAIRRRWPRLHRMLGWVYVVCSLISIPFVMRLSFATSCAECIPPFVVWTLVWFIVTGAAILTAIRREFDAHRQFMIRSWVLMNGFVFVRLDTHLEYPLPAGTGVNRAAMVLWVAWVVPLMLTELWLSWRPLWRGRKRPAVKRAAGIAEPTT